jgi:hypothetical protein
MTKTQVQQQLDDRFVILRPYDSLINCDNTVRFYAMDSITKEVILLKLYFKGDAKNKIFFHENTDPKFKDNSQDCLNSKLILNRVYGKPLTNTDSIIEGKDKLVYPNFETTRCFMTSGGTGSKSAYYSIFEVPIGEKLSKKCLHERLTNENSCIEFLKVTTAGVINGIKLLNTGKEFYKHGNIRPNNIYLYRRNDTEKIMLDSMVFDKETYDDPNNKPYRSDLNMLGETLIQLISGNINIIEVIKENPDSTFNIFTQIRKYFKNKSIDISVKQRALGVKDDIQDYLGKQVTLAEYEFKLQKSIFNFIWRLKCTANSNNQFMDLDQVLQHEFMKDANETKDQKDNWAVEPAHY